MPRREHAGKRPECGEHKPRAFKGVSVLAWPGRPSLGCTRAGLPLSSPQLLSLLVRADCEAALWDKLAGCMHAGTSHSQPYQLQRCPALSVLVGAMSTFGEGSVRQEPAVNSKQR